MAKLRKIAPGFQTVLVPIPIGNDRFIGYWLWIFKSIPMLFLLSHFALENITFINSKIKLGEWI